VETGGKGGGACLAKVVSVRWDTAVPKCYLIFAVMNHFRTISSTSVWKGFSPQKRVFVAAFYFIEKID
jgi:hypothetical protein